MYKCWCLYLLVTPRLHPLFFASLSENIPGFQFPLLYEKYFSMISFSQQVFVDSLYENLVFLRFLTLSRECMQKFVGIAQMVTLAL